jgi:hypothetical protein
MIISSCSNSDVCTQNKSVISKIGFYNILDTKKKITGSDSILTYSPDSITIIGYRNDTIFTFGKTYYKTPKLSFVSLPLNKFDTVSKFIVTFQSSYTKKEPDPSKKESIITKTYKTTKTDTITIHYMNEDYYLSFECGCIKTHSLTKVTTTGHFIDSVSIALNKVNTQYNENIKLYTDSTHIKAQVK